ncbi:MAG: ABC transporter permease [Myxococcota bacterium]
MSPLSETEDVIAEQRAAIARRAQKRVAEIVAQAEAPGQRGAWTLFVREFLRFWSMARQTLVSPVITTMLYFLIFGYSLGDRLKTIQGIPYVDFLVPGLVMLALINNAYLNASFSLFIGKIHGQTIDLLVTPLSYLQFMVAYISAAICRAMMVGTIIWGVSMVMGASAVFSLPIIFLFMILTALMFSLLGLIVAIVAEEFDQVNLLPSFIITPLTFLGGVFYSIEMLPSPWDTVSRFNPVLYMVNGLRYGMTGIADVPVWQGMVLVSTLCVGLGSVAWWLLKSGYNLRA